MMDREFYNRIEKEYQSNNFSGVIKLWENLKERDFDFRNEYDLLVCDIIAMSYYKLNRLDKSYELARERIMFMKSYISVYDREEHTLFNLNYYYSLLSGIFRKLNNKFYEYKILWEYENICVIPLKQQDSLNVIEEFYLKKYLYPFSKILFPLIYSLIIVSLYSISGINPYVFILLLVMELCWILFMLFFKGRCKKILISFFRVMIFLTPIPPRIKINTSFNRGFTPPY